MFSTSGRFAKEFEKWTKFLCVWQVLVILGNFELVWTGPPQPCHFLDILNNVGLLWSVFSDSLGGDSKAWVFPRFGLLCITLIYFEWVWVEAQCHVFPQFFESIWDPFHLLRFSWSKEHQNLGFPHFESLWVTLNYFELVWMGGQKPYHFFNIFGYFGLVRSIFSASLSGGPATLLLCIYFDFKFDLLSWVGTPVSW